MRKSEAPKSDRRSVDSGADPLDLKALQLFSHIWFMTERLKGLLSSCGEGECPLSAQETRAIEFLGRLGACKMRDLAEHLGLAVSSTTTLVDNLEFKGVVQRMRSSEDRRVIMLQLTGQGRQNYEFAMALFLKYCRGILTALTDADQDHLLRIMSQIRQVQVP